MVKFIHTADIHLDSPLRGLERYEGAPVEYMRNATRKAFENLIEVSLEEKVDFVLIAGDLYDGDWRDYNTGLFFLYQVARLNEAGIKVFIVRGNHDAASQLTKRLRYPENVFEFSTKKPESVFLEDLGVVIHGQGFSNRSVTDNLSLNYPEPIDNYFNIGLLHTSVDGREGHDPYAPCTVRELIAKGYNYWALGHVHKREIISETPYIVFPGNIQGRHARESGSKGCTIVTLQGNDICEIEHRDLDVLRYSVCDVDVTGLIDQDHIIEKVIDLSKVEIDRADGRLVALRFIIIGPTKFDHSLQLEKEKFINNIRAELTNHFYDRAWVEKIIVQTTSQADLVSLLSKHDPVSYLLRYIEELPRDQSLIREIEEELSDLRTILPLSLLGNADWELNLKDDKSLNNLINSIQQVIVSRLVDGGGFEE